MYIPFTCAVYAHLYMTLLLFDNIQLCIVTLNLTLKPIFDLDIWG
jgi:hypothetical protein